MADEIAQVCQMEIEGAKILLKGSLEMIKFLARALKAIFEAGGNVVGSVKEHNLNKSGDKSLQDIWKLSEGQPPQVIQVDESILKSVLAAAEKAGLRYCMVPDLNNSDGKTPIALAPQDAVVFASIVQTHLEKEVSLSQRLINAYDKQIAALKDEYLKARPKEKHKISVKIENIEQAKEELFNLMHDKQERLENGCISSFTDYLATGIGTDFEKDPERAIKGLNEGAEICPSFKAKDCFQPIRNKALVPDSAMRFYYPEIGVEVERQFKEEKGIVYSEYTFKDENGKKFKFSDKDMTKEEWNNKVLPEMLDKSGILEETECKCFDTAEKLKKYKKHMEQIIKDREKEKAEGKYDNIQFSDAELDKQFKKAADNELKNHANAELSGDKVVLEIPEEDFTQKHGKINIAVGEENYEISGVKFQKNKDGKVSLIIDKDSDVLGIDKNNKERHLKGSDLRDEIKDARKTKVNEVAEKFKKASR